MTLGNEELVAAAIAELAKEIAIVVYNKWRSKKKKKKLKKIKSV